MANDLQNFIGGQWTDLSYDKRADLIDPSTSEGLRHRSDLRTSRDRRCLYFRRRGFSRLAGPSATLASSAAWQLLRIADALEARADQFVKAESQNTGKPLALTASEEIPPMVDQIRVLHAGCGADARRPVRR